MALLTENKQIGKLTLIRKIDTKNWLCKCKCGNEITMKSQTLKTAIIRNSKNTSCGCYFHGDAGKTKLHGVWAGMKRRCNNENTKHYNRYGGRGITVCEEWQEFPNFKKWAIDNGYKGGLTVDRIDNNKGYEPSNCRLVTIKENINNRDITKKAEYNGKLMLFTDIAKETNIKIKTLYERNRKGVELTKPIKENLSITINGEKITLLELSKQTGIKIKTLYSRFKKGYSPEDIVKPVKI